MYGVKCKLHASSGCSYDTQKEKVDNEKLGERFIFQPICPDGQYGLTIVSNQGCKKAMHYKPYI